MALVSDQIALERAYTPYQRVSDRAAVRTAIPRGLVSFVVRGAATQAKPINDDYLISFAATLPTGFGFVLNEIHFNGQFDTANDFNGLGLFRLSQPSAALRDFDYRMGLQLSATSQNGSTIGVVCTRNLDGTLSRTPIVPPQAGSSFALSFSNLADPAMAVGVADVVISFFEYDLEQITWFPANVPLQVQGR